MHFKGIENTSPLVTYQFRYSRCPLEVSCAIDDEDVINYFYMNTDLLYKHKKHGIMTYSTNPCVQWYNIAATITASRVGVVEGETLRYCYLLDMVDLVMFAFLVTRDLPLGLIPQISTLLHTLPHRIFHRLCQRQATLAHPLVKSPVN